MAPIRTELRIALLTPDYPPIHGGVAVSTRRLAASLSTLGHDVTVIVPHQSPHYIPRPRIHEQLDQGHRVIRVFLSSRHHPEAASWHLSGLGGMSQLFLYIRFLCRHLNPDVLHAFTLFPFGFLATLVANELACPAVVGVRGNDITGNMFSPHLLPTIERTVHLSSLVCPVSSDLRRYLAAICPAYVSKLRVISNGIDAVSASARRVFGNSNAVVFGTVCGVRPKKDIGVLVDAFRALFATRPNARLLLVGLNDAAERQRIVAGLPDEVVCVLPEVPRSDALDMIAGMDVFVIPSVFDGCPNTLLEALALGVPVIAANVGGAADLIASGENGLLFDTLDVLSLTARMEELMDSSRRSQLARQARCAVRPSQAEAAEWTLAYRDCISVRTA